MTHSIAEPLKYTQVRHAAPSTDNALQPLAGSLFHEDSQALISATTLRSLEQLARAGATVKAIAAGYGFSSVDAFASCYRADEETLIALELIRLAHRSQ